MPYNYYSRSRYNRPVGPYRTFKKYTASRRRSFRPPLRRRPRALSGLTYNVPQFGVPRPLRRTPPPYAEQKDLPLFNLICGRQGKVSENAPFPVPIMEEMHCISDLGLPDREWTAGLKVTVSVPVMAPGSLYVAEVLCTAVKYTVESTTALNSSLPYRPGSTRLPTRKPGPGYSFSSLRLVIRHPGTYTRYFNLAMLNGTTVGGREAKSEGYFLEHMYGCVSGERHVTLHTRSFYV